MVILVVSCGLRWPVLVGCHRRNWKAEVMITHPWSRGGCDLDGMKIYEWHCVREGDPRWMEHGRGELVVGGVT